MLRKWVYQYMYRFRCTVVVRVCTISSLEEYCCRPWASDYSESLVVQANGNAVAVGSSIAAMPRPSIDQGAHLYTVSENSPLVYDMNSTRVPVI